LLWFFVATNVATFLHGVIHHRGFWVVILVPTQKVTGIHVSHLNFYHIGVFPWLTDLDITTTDAVKESKTNPKTTTGQVHCPSTKNPNP